MGRLCEHAIVVTGYYPQGDHWADIAHGVAVDIFGRGLVSPVIHGVVNDVRSFFIAPDGSKEGWSESDEHDKKRAEYVKWLEAQAYEDGSSPLAWALIQYGDEGDDNRMLRDSQDGTTIRRAWDRVGR